jgi:hypothetical protein
MSRPDTTWSPMQEGFQRERKYNSNGLAGGHYETFSGLCIRGVIPYDKPVVSNTIIF